MQIKFLTLYHDFDDPSYGKSCAQDNLLYMWQQSLQLRQIKYISNAKVEFKDYSFFDYPDQEKVRKEIHNTYGHKCKNKDDNSFIYRWCEKTYSDLDSIYNALAKQKRLMELIITVEDY